MKNRNLTNIKGKPNITNMSVLSNPLFITVMLILALILILSVFKAISPYLNLSLGINAHIGDLKGSFELEAFNNLNELGNSNNPNKEALFVMYYAEWCGHCKRTMPEFQKLMDNYKGNVKVMAINSEDQQQAELVKSQKIEGFPTIRLYPDGLSNDYKDYNGGRTYSDFVEYLGSIEGNPDKMPDQAAPFI